MLLIWSRYLVGAVQLLALRRSAFLVGLRSLASTVLPLTLWRRYLVGLGQCLAFLLGRRGLGRGRVGERLDSCGRLAGCVLDFMALPLTISHGILLI